MMTNTGLGLLLKCDIDKILLDVDYEIEHAASLFLQLL